MRSFARASALVLTVLAVAAACAGRGEPAPVNVATGAVLERALRLVADSAGVAGPLWARANLAAVAGVPADRSASVAVDPRPIAIPEGPALPDASSYHRDREAGVRWLVDRLMAAGVDTVRSFPLNPECSGFLVPPPYKTVEGCPSSFQSEFIFDIAEPEGDGSVWTVRMLDISYTPGGGALRSIGWCWSGRARCSGFCAGKR